MKNITIAQLLDMHNQIIQRAPNDLKALKPNMTETDLESLLQQPLQSNQNSPVYPSIFDKAAVLMQKLTKQNLFIDGNKRTAFMVTWVFLKINEWELQLDTKLAVGLMLKISINDDTDIHMHNLSRFLKAHCIKSPHF